MVGNHTATLVSYPTIVIGRKGSVGAITYAPNGGWTIDTAFYVEPKHDNRVDMRYLFYALKNLKLAQFTITTAIPGLNRDNIYRSEIPLPPLAEQKRTAAILDKADALRTLRRDARKRLDALTQSLFLEMFGDLNTTTYPVRPLSEVCKRVTDGIHQPPKFVSSGIPFIFVSNITTGYLTLNAQKFIDDATYEELTRRCPIENGDVLYSTVGSYGVAALVEGDKKFCFQRHIAHIKPDAERITPMFLQSMLNSRVGKRQADETARGIAQKTINLADIKKYRVIVPPIALQNQFADAVTRIEALRTRHTLALSEHDALFASLQARAFAGTLFDAPNSAPPP